MLQSIDAPQGAFPNFNPVELDEMIIPEYPQYSDHIITDNLPAVAPTKTTPKKKGKMSRDRIEAYEKARMEYPKDKMGVFYVPNKSDLQLLV